jgi:hypothetical protein
MFLRDPNLDHDVTGIQKPSSETSTPKSVAAWVNPSVSLGGLASAVGVYQDRHPAKLRRVLYDSTTDCLDNAARSRVGERADR